MVLLVGLLTACGQPVADQHPPVEDAATAVTGPPTGGGFDYQLDGDYPVIPDGDLVVRQWADGSPDPDLYSVCYFNAFQTESDANGAGGEENWPESLVLEDTDPEWPGEHPIDIGTEAHREEATEFVSRALTTCAERGFDAVEFDNLDSYLRYPNLPFGREDAIAYAGMLVEAATRVGLAAGQKNAPELLDVGRSTIGFDFAIVEQCGQYDECEQFVDTYGSAVFDVEYTDDGLAAACRAIGDKAAVIRRDLALSPAGSPDHVYRTC